IAPGSSTAVPVDGDVNRWIKFAASLLSNRLPPADLNLPLFEYPHDVIRHNLATINDSLEFRLNDNGVQEIAPGVFAASGATLGQYCVTDTTKGPVLLDQGATVGPYSLLRGPAYLGPKARVIEHSAIKDAVSLGHTTKIGGEIEGSIVEPYT